nr:MAG TPA: Head decoration protein, Viral protein.5A [Caudoviricetes sp.]
MAMQEKYTTGVDNLFAANQTMPVVTDAITVPAGEPAMKRGTLIASTGKAVTAAADVYGVLAKDVDASKAAVETVAYLTGEFNEKAMAVGTPETGTLTVDDCKVAARKVGIFIKSNQE